ncbi:MAG: ABC transporter, partial [Treponema sp.]|nr:ABC transporter [Treponema sp.]
MRKSFAVLLIFLAAFSFLTACSGDNSSKSGSGSMLVGIAIPETHVQRWVKDGAALKKYAESLGYRAE